MPFPLTHLCVAWHIIEKSGSKNAAQFILGSIAPDAVHHREEFINGYNPSIGAEKKITHLCPISDERWGHVTDNEGWEERVKKFLREHANNAFAAGYAAHVLTDICNNKTLWYNFRTNFPQEAVKGYTSEYYSDLKHIDALLYTKFPAVPEIMKLLSQSVAENLPGLVTEQECNAIKNNLLNEHFKNADLNENHVFKFVTYEDTLNFINDASSFVLKSYKNGSGEQC